MLKTLFKKFPKYSKNSFSNLVTGFETSVYYFEPKQKCSNRVWANKNALRPSIAKRQRMIKKVFYKGPVMQLPVPKGRPDTGAFYNKV